MALPTNALATFEQIGRREDLSNIIYRIDPTGYAVLLRLRWQGKRRNRYKATNGKPEVLAPASTSNAQLEGDDANPKAITARVRLGQQYPDQHLQDRGGFRYRTVCSGCWRSELNSPKPGNAGWSGTSARRGNRSSSPIRPPMPAQTVLRAFRLRSHGVDQVRTLPRVRRARAADPSTADGVNIRTDGTQIAFTEPRMKTVLSAIWIAGGKPRVVA